MSEELLKLALQAACEKEFAVFDTGEEHVFSFRHKRKIKKLFKQYYNVPKTDTTVKMPLKKRIITAICVVILAVILTVGVVAIATNGFKFDKKQDHTETLTVNWENSPKTIEDTYYLAALPGEYELVESSISATLAEFIFEDNNGNFLSFTQNVKKDFHAFLNTEGYDLEETTVNNHSGFFINYDSEMLMIWDNGDYIIALLSNIAKEEMLNLAKSAEIKKD